MSSFWSWFVIILTVGNIVGCWWLLMWTKGVSNRQGNEIGTTGHTWDGLTELNNPLPRWWLYLFHITIVFSLVYMVLFPGLGNFKGTLGWTQVGKYEGEMAAAEAAQQTLFSQYMGMEPVALIASADAMDTGRRLFANNCAMCHGSDGRGAPGFPNLADGVWQWGGGYDNVRLAIDKGRQAAMPPMGAALGEDGVLEVTVYVQQLAGLKADPQLAARGKVKYEQVCAACHLADGSGNPALGAPALNDNVWLYGSDPATIAEGINLGRNGNMPGHESLLSEERRHILAAYVLSLSEGSETE